MQLQLSMPVVDLMVMTCCVIVLDNRGEELEDTLEIIFCVYIKPNQQAQIRINQH
jgi:hypothetical protein